MGFGIRPFLLVSSLVAGAAFATPLRPFAKAALTRQDPQKILVLGGDADRERIGLRLARQLELPLVVSGGTNPEYAQWLMEHEGLGQNEVRLDYRAQDTLGNFTSLVDELQGEEIEHVLLVTSEDHLPRACISVRFGPHPHAHVSPGRGAGGGPRHQLCPPARHRRPVPQGFFR